VESSAAVAAAAGSWLKRSGAFCSEGRKRIVRGLGFLSSWKEWSYNNNNRRRRRRTQVVVCVYGCDYGI
jgi:hypothetical protein